MTHTSCNCSPGEEEHGISLCDVQLVWTYFYATIPHSSVAMATVPDFQGLLRKFFCSTFSEVPQNSMFTYKTQICSSMLISIIVFSQRV